ncbi:hypothetical protein [Pseudomonas sp.]|uniref:hypothetical protein n=1 Tax=Pseudomonas sp. TaxID=306 RepID=UPI003FD8EF3C
MPLDEFIGIILENPNGSFYKVVDVNGLKGSSRKYKVDCSVCSEDTELYPELWSRKSDLLQGKLCCGCSKNPQSYTKEQWEILCKRHADKIGVTFLGIDPDYYKCNVTKVSFIDSFGTTQSNMTISYFLKRYNPILNSISNIKNRPSKKEDHYSNKLIEKFNFPKGTLIKRVYDDGELTKSFLVFCPICASSNICKDGVTSPWFKSLHSSISAGHRPCFCSPVYKYSRDEYVHKLKNNLVGVGDFVGILEPFQGNSSIFKWTCSCGANREQRISDFLVGKSVQIVLYMALKMSSQPTYMPYSGKTMKNLLLKLVLQITLFTPELNNKV